MAEYKSKHGTVSRNNMELYMGFSDLRNLAAMVPEDKREGVKADYDRLEATVQGFTIAVKVRSRVPYTRIELEDDNAPFHFSIALNFNFPGWRAAQERGLEDPAPYFPLSAVSAKNASRLVRAAAHLGQR